MCNRAQFEEYGISSHVLKTFFFLVPSFLLKDPVVPFDAYNSLLIMPIQAHKMENTIPVFVPKEWPPE